MFMRSLCAGIIMALLPAVACALELTGQDNGKSVSLSMTETLTVTLAGNPTTGYLWELTAVDREVLAMETEPVFAPDSSLTGAGGKFTFRFTPRKPGTSTVKLVYRRPWEKGAEPLQSFDLTVAVTVAEPHVNSASYRSSQGEVLQASFDLDLNQVTVLLPDGRSVTLLSAPSGSGARYSDGTETFWEHQGIGRFFKGDTVLFEGALQPERENTQPRFRRFSSPDMLKVTRNNGKNRIAEEVRAPEGGYSFRNSSDNVIEVRTGKPKRLVLSVPKFSHRPLNARWVNAKLLYLELWFNPHNGAYWIYDVERERVLTRELLNDGFAQ